MLVELLKDMSKAPISILLKGHLTNLLHQLKFIEYPEE